MNSLFSPGKLGHIEINNRIIMAPLTRTRCDKGHIPSHIMAEHACPWHSPDIPESDCCRGPLSTR